MSESFITRRGGGIPYAVIGVTYPSGSTCTCTNGTLTLTAKDTSGKAVFPIPYAGTWTVKAVSGSQSKSKAVSITADGQFAAVTLAYELALFKDGAYQEVGSFSNATITGGNLVMYGSGGSGMTPVYKTFITDVKLDLTNYTTLTFSLANFNISNSDYQAYRTVHFGVCANTFGNTQVDSSNVKAETVLTYSSNGNDKTVKVDISALKGSFYVFVNESIYGSINVSNKSIIID